MKTAKQEYLEIRFRDPSVMNDNYSHGDPTNNYTDQANQMAKREGAKWAIEQIKHLNKL